MGEVKVLELNVGALQLGPYTPGWYWVDSQLCYFDGTAWWVYAAGYVYPMGDVPTGLTPQTPPKKVTLTFGDKLRVSYSYKYAGFAQTVTEVAVICVYGAFGGTTKVKGTKARDLPQCSVATTFTGSIDLTIPADVAADWDDIAFWVEGKWWAAGAVVSVGGVLMEQALTMVAVEVPAPAFTEFKIVDYVKV